MFLTDNDSAFIYFRAFGMIGLILFLIICQRMLFFIADKKVNLLSFYTLESVAGVIILAIAIHPGSIRIIHTNNGIITEFISPALSLIYTAYTIVVAIYFTVIVLSLLRTSKKKRIISFGKRFLMVEGLVILGMVVDTVLPACGINLNIPASTILQFVGLELIYVAVHKINRNRISIANMAGYIYKSMKTPVLIFDSADTLQIYNKEAASIFNLDTVDTEHYEFWNAELGIEAPEFLDEAHETITLETVYKDTQHFKLYVDSIHDDYDDYLGYIVSINDISEIVNNMKELETAKDEALSANKSKSLFLANMSHEIRTPMNSILGFSELALRDNIDPAAKGYFEDIRNSAAALLAIINDILDISKIESGKMELIPEKYYPARLFDDVSLIIKMQADKKNLDFEMDIASDYPSVLFGDKTKIREILINLLNNSVKYTNEGKVTLKASCIKENDDNGTIKFEIIDTGIGIKEDEIEKVFSSFQRVDLAANKNTEGTGLGLSIVKGYIELMGGSIDVSSVYGQGSTFTVTIRQQILNAEPITLYNRESSEAQKPDRLQFKDINVLAVDDSKVNLKVINMTMGHYGLKIDLASSGAEAIEMCKAKSYDIVLMDQMMPQMDGVEAMKIIRELGNGYEKGGKNKIIVLTANAIAGTKEILVQEGFDDYIGKPINFNVLEHVFTTILPEDKWFYMPQE